MEPSLVLEQRPAVTPQLILANRLLQLSAAELERAIAQELAANPLLELAEIPRCPHCDQAMPEGYCPTCVGPDALEAVIPADWESDAPSWERDDVADAEDDDGVARLASATTLAEHLLRQARLVLSAQDLPIAAFLVENLDDHGFLRCDLDEAAVILGVERTRVESVLSTIQGLDPVGVAARDARECLLIQLEHLRGEGDAQPLAEALIRDHWEALGDPSFARIARIAGATVGEVQAALQFIRDKLNPYPAQAEWGDLHESPPQRVAIYPRPDVVIRDDPGAGYEIELPGARLYRLCIGDSYLEAVEHKAAFARQDWERWEEFYGRARLFIKSVEQRWQTLRQLVSYLVDYQRDFLIGGDRHLKPLTRAQLAEALGVHESTVSRAVAGKFVQLPCGRIVPLARFFDRAAPLKEAIRELIAQEDEPLSDRALAERLAQEGFRVARRTVTKYRNALNILPSSLRCRRYSSRYKTGLEARLQPGKPR